MNTRREEEVIIADGPQERGLCRGRVFGSGPGGWRADQGAPGDFRERSSRLAPQLKRLVFEEEGRKIGLLPYEVDF